MIGSKLINFLKLSSSGLITATQEKHNKKFSISSVTSSAWVFVQVILNQLNLNIDMIFFIHLQLKINSTISQDTKSNANIHHREVSVCFI